MKIDYQDWEMDRPFGAERGSCSTEQDMPHE